MENARLYTLPDEPPPIMVAASGPQAAEVAGRIGDGLINVAPASEIVDCFNAAGGSGKPRYGQLTVCWAQNEAAARRTAHKYWPNAGIQGELSQELPTPAYFEQAARMVREDDVTQKVVCGPDPERHISEVKKFAEAGYDHIYIHQIGPDQDGFLQFYAHEVMPKLR